MRFISLVALSLLVACGDDDLTPVDAGHDVSSDAGTDAADADDAGRPCTAPDVEWRGGVVRLTPGVTRSVAVSLARDFCEDLTFTFSTSAAGIITVPADQTLASGQSRIFVDIVGEAVGETTLTVSYTDALDESVRSADLQVLVEDTTVPACSGTATGALTPGSEVSIADGPMAGVGIALPEGASRDDIFHVDSFNVTVSCAPDQVPAGYIALGPAITFEPEYMQLTREIPFTIPSKLALVPSGRHRGMIQMSYTGAGATEPRVVAVASPDYESTPGRVRFLAPRTGTYQLVVRQGEPVAREREFGFRGITGVSMGSGGAALIGTHNPERFDFVAPLGGPVDWVHMLRYIRDYHLGGFCSDAEFQADMDGCLEGARTSRTPPNDELYEVRQDFEHWNYVDEYGGQGGTFDRREYIQIFRDLSYMYGNANSTRSADPLEPNLTPPGVPDSFRLMTDAQQCAMPVVLAGEAVGGDSDPATGFFDDEYNPDGVYPVMTVCDGPELRVDGDRDIGVWDPDGDQNYPLGVALAVDWNGNGRRDAGEPIIRQGRENFEDCGLDQLCNPDEPGYDAIANPDPAGDDYDFQYNPHGTEQNWLRDTTASPVGDCTSPDPTPAPGVGERFSDTGLDGVAGTAQLTEGGYDFGEGDGCWTLSRGMQRMLDLNPRGFVERAPEAVVRDLDFFSDGGVRDLFNFAANQNHLAGAFGGRGLGLSLFNSHAALRYDGATADSAFDYTGIDWTQVGKYVHVRYGNPDASEGALVQGDGGHVGTPAQIIARLVSVMAWMSNRWPGGDRTVLTDRVCLDVGPGCPRANQFVFDFTSSVGRTGPATVILPPGYFDEAYADVTYPVVYLLHGYGMAPEDLQATGIIIWNYMISRRIPEADRLQKMIFVFPDGLCRGDECLQGTFYADAPESTPGGAQMETFMLELMDHIDANYRTRAPERHTVYE